MKRIVLTVLVAGLLIGCQQQTPNNTSTNDTPITPEPEPTPEPDDTASDVQQLQIQLTGQSIQPAPINAEPGQTVINVTNTGTLYNELKIVGPNVNVNTSNGVFPNRSKTLEANLSEGTYEVYSPIPGKRDNGFEAQLRVE